MISSVSNVNFRGDAAPVNAQDLINSPGKYTTQAPKAEAPADSFEKEGAAAEKKKSKAPAIIGTVVGLLAAAYVGLSIAVGKKALTRAVAEEGKELGFMGKVKNFFVSIGESGEKLWNKIRGKKVEDGDVKTKGETPEPKKPETDKGPEVNNNNKPEENKASGGENKAEGDKKSEGNKAPEGENKAEGDKKPEENKAPEGENKAEGDKKPEENKAPEGENKAEGDKKPEENKAPEGENKAEGDKKPEENKTENQDKQN